MLDDTLCWISRFQFSWSSSRFKFSVFHGHWFGLRFSSFVESQIHHCHPPEESTRYIPGLKVKPFDKAARNEARDFYVLYAELGPGPSLEALREGFINSWTTAGHPGKPKFKVRRVVRVGIDTTNYWIKIFTGGLGTRWTMKGIPIVDKEGKRQER
jgi:hypothetical protein